MAVGKRVCLVIDEAKFITHERAVKRLDCEEI